MKILITGGTGMVGRGIKAIVDGKFKSQLFTPDELKKYTFVYLGSKDADLCDLKQTTDIFEKHKPDAVIHLAGNVGGLFKNMSQNLKMFEDNIKINMNVVSMCKHSGVKHGIFCLSTCIFPDHIEQYPITESMLHDGRPHQSNEGYSYAKRMLEIHSRLHSTSDELNYQCVIPTNVYGPHDNFDKEQSHVAPALIRRCNESKQSNEPFVVFGSGTPLRQFIYVYDLADLILWNLLKNKSTKPMILAPSTEISIAELAKTIAKSYEYINHTEFDTNYADGQYRKTVSNAYLKSKLPDYKFTTFQKGIQKTVDWFQDPTVKKRLTSSTASASGAK